jgi:uncharacterized protein
MTETVFAPIHGAVGGALIGLSATLLMYFYGRIAGLSSIFGGLLTLRFDANLAWRAVFILGLLLGAAITGAMLPETRELAFVKNPIIIAVGGILVGLGVTLGSGCTSGHGICGLARFSPRSLAATCVFMAIAVLTVTVLRHVIGAA